MHRDLNDIIPPSRRRPLSPEGGMEPVRPSVDMAPSWTPPERPATAAPEPVGAVPPMAKPPKRARLDLGSNGRRFPIGTALIALVVIATCGVVLYVFAGAKVAITPVTNAASIQADMVATAGQGDLPFQIVSVEKTATANVPAESTETANDPATGTITISNKQANAQALIKNTRFATPDGLVFRIHDSVTIPAGGTTKVPVYADEAGTKYNVGPTSFTVPGLKGSKVFDLVTATSDAPMTGGFSGTRPSVAQATKDKQYATIQAQLTTELEKELASKIPAGYVLIPGASFPSYAPQPDTAGASGTVTLTEKGVIMAVVFPEDAIARAVAFKAVGTYGGQPVTFAAVDKLLVKPVETTLAPDASDFKFTISGTATILWTVDTEKIAGAVAGKTRDSAELALQSFPEVDKATLVLRPFWSHTLPADPKKIKVTVSVPGAGK